MKLLLTTLHSKYIHSSLALPCLAAYCFHVDGVGIVIREFTINEDAYSVLAAILEESADVAAFSCYIWNVEQTLNIVSRLKKLRPDTFVMLGGPEVSFDAGEILEKNGAVDCIVKGEGEAVFRSVVERLNGGDGKATLDGIAGIAFRRGGEIVDNPASDIPFELETLPSPFAAGLADKTKPLTYYETSRGCPFSCAFCLSSIEGMVRSFSMERIKDDLRLLMEAGAGTIKFVDRTFNYRPERADGIWGFILENRLSGRYHFEIAADLLTDSNIVLLRRVPKETFRFEIGVQSIAEETLDSVGRRSDLEKLFRNVRRLLEETEIDIHLDLVAGLPGEDFGGFLSSLERLFALWPDHIQAEPLKVLKGAPMMEIAKREGYFWSDTPPYRIIETPWLAPGEVELIETVGRLLELIYNSGRFRMSLEQISRLMPLSRFFARLAEFWDKERIAALSLEALFEYIWDRANIILADVDLTGFQDALVFERCMADYPDHKRLPSYFSSGKGFGCTVSRDETGVIRERAGVPPESRVRGFRWRFGRDFSRDGKEGETELLFVYISTAGRRQEVRIMDGDGAELRSF